MQSRKIITGILFLSALIWIDLHVALAQVPVTKSINKVIIEGKVYYIHQVIPGQTIYSISKAYEITEAEIIRENPGSDKILSAGQVLKIPAFSSVTAEPRIQQPGIREPVYRKHIINEGETLYSLSKIYNVPVQEIEKANPALILTDIPIGQVINIPGIIQPAVQMNFLYHRVKRKETIYGICRKYQITEEELKMFNPELNESLPRAGQHLRIPLKTKSAIITSREDTIAVISDSLSISLIAADSLNKIILYDYYLDSLPPISGRSLNIAYLIPFNYSRDTTRVLLNDEELADLNKGYQGKTEANLDILPESQDFLEFMEGTLLVVDQLRQKGISVNIFVFDTQRSTERVKEIIGSNRFDKMDLIIGPFFSFNVEIVSEYSRQNRIPLISPFYDKLELAEGNPYLFQVNPSFFTECDLLANCLVTGGKGKNIILIHQRDSIRNIKREYLRSKINEEINLSDSPDSIEFRELIFDHANKINFQSELTSSLSKTKENLIVIDEIDEVFVKPMVSQLYFLPKIYQVKLFGLANWMTFQSVDYSYFHHLGLSFFTPYYFSYDSPDVKIFLRTYSDEFYAEPASYTRRGCSYALIGHDISNYFLKLIGKFGRRFIMHLDEKVEGQVMNDFNFKRINNTGGYENRSLMLVTFSPDLNITARKYSYIPVIDPTETERPQPDINIPGFNNPSFHLP